VRQAGLVNVLVTNGYVNPAPAADMLALTDAVNVDVKAFNEDYYRIICRGKLRPVLDFLVQARKAGVHVEVSLPLVEGWNDKDAAPLAGWIAKELGDRTPLHIVRVFAHNRTKTSTTVEAVERAYRAARKSLKFVYTTERQDTVCPDCGKVMVARDCYKVTVNAKECCGKGL
jgi:pyruvate formate lyase activating enzyme